MLPVDEQLFREDQAAIIRNLQKRVKRLETLEEAGGGDWVLIETITLSSDGDPVEFASIPQLHQHLFVLYSAGSTGTIHTPIRMNFNNDVGNRYNYLATTLTTAAGQVADTAENVGFMHVGRASNQVIVGDRLKNFAAGHIFIADYRGTDNYKGMVFSNHYDSLGGLEIPDGLASVFGGGTWEMNPPEAITEIDFTLPTPPTDFRAGTVFSLYGVN